MGYSNNSQRLKVFLCHSSNDKATVRNLYRKLDEDNIHPWLDEEELLPGQDWNHEITKAVRNSHVVIVCLSRGAVSKSGYIHKEISQALDVADEQPDDTIFIIPLKLEECEVPERLRRWYWVKYFEERGYDRLIKALQTRAQSLDISLSLGTDVAETREAARENQFRPKPIPVEPRPIDIFTKKLNEAAERAEQERITSISERERITRFAEVARQEGPKELERMERIFHEKSDSFNKSNKPTTVPDLSYDDKSHVLDAKKYAVSLELYIGQVYEVRMIVGLHPNAALFMAELPEVGVTRWHLRSSADEDGFFWYEINEDRRLSSEEIVDAAMEALTDLLTAEM